MVEGEASNGCLSVKFVVVAGRTKDTTVTKPKSRSSNRQRFGSVQTVGDCYLEAGHDCAPSKNHHLIDWYGMVWYGMEDHAQLK